MFSKSSIPFSVGGQGSVPSLLFGLGTNYGRGNGNLLQKRLCQHHCSQCPWPCGRPLSTHASARGSWTLTGKSGSAFCGVTAPFSWVLFPTRFCSCPPEDHVPVLWKFCNQTLVASKVKFPGDSQSFCWILWLGNLLWVLEISKHSESFLV